MNPRILEEVGLGSAIVSLDRVCVDLPPVVDVIYHEDLKAFDKLTQLHIEFAIVSNREVGDLLSELFGPPRVIIMEGTIVSAVNAVRVSDGYQSISYGSLRIKELVDSKDGVSMALFQAKEGLGQVAHVQIILGETVLKQFEEVLSTIGIVYDLKDTSGRPREHPPDFLGISSHQLTIVAIKLSESLLSQSTPIVIVNTSSGEDGNVS